MVSQYQASASWTYRHGLTRISNLAQVNRVQLAASIRPIRPGLVPVWYGAQGQPQGREVFVSALWSHRRCRYRRRTKHSRSHLGDFRECRVPGASKGCGSVGVISDYSFLNSGTWRRFKSGFDNRETSESGETLHSGSQAVKAILSFCRVSITGRFWNTLN